MPEKMKFHFYLLQQVLNLYGQVWAWLTLLIMNF